MSQQARCGSITKSAAIELAGTGVRVNIVALVHGNQDVQPLCANKGKQSKFLEAHIPTKRMGSPKRLQMPRCSLV